MLRILTTSEFLAGGEIVLLVALAMIFAGIYSINLYIIYLVQQTKWLPLMIGIAAAINAIINVVLIPRIGITGAAISTITSYFLLAAAATAWAKRVVGYTMDFKFLAKVIVATLVMAFCLKLIATDSALSIVLAMLGGAIIFGAGLFLLRAFSKADLKLMKEAVLILNIKFGK
jgi:O-antigen/teichoic acid export membrane protein